MGNCIFLVINSKQKRSPKRTGGPGKAGRRRVSVSVRSRKRARWSMMSGTVAAGRPARARCRRRHGEGVFVCRPRRGNTTRLRATIISALGGGGGGAFAFNRREPNPLVNVHCILCGRGGGFSVPLRPRLTVVRTAPRRDGYSSDRSSKPPPPHLVPLTVDVYARAPALFVNCLVKHKQLALPPLPAVPFSKTDATLYRYTRTYIYILYYTEWVDQFSFFFI